MLEQVSNAITFFAFFVASKVGKASLADVTVDVYNPAGSKIVAAGATSEVGGGLYSYTLAAESVASAGEYVAIFKTADATVDQKEIPSLWAVGRAGVENLDAAISTRNSTTPPTAAAIADAVLDEALADHVGVGSAGKKLGDITASPPTAAAIADAVCDEALADHNTTGSVGAALGRIGTAEVITSAPVASDGEIDLVRGDDYLIDDGRELTFSSTTWPDLTDATDIVLTVRRRREAFGSGSDPVLISRPDDEDARDVGGATQVLTFELQSEDPGDGEDGEGNTNDLLPGDATGKYDIQATLASGAIVTLTTGVVNVTEDQTRA